jgi:hypothetical protein
MITKEFLVTHFQGRDDADQHVEAIFAEYDKEKLAILKNRDDIKAEKDVLEKKSKENEAKIVELEAAKKELDDKIKSGTPEKDRQVFEAEAKKLNDRINLLTDENSKMKSEYDSDIRRISDEKTHYIIGEEFSKLINANAAIKPTMRNGLIKRFFSDYPKAEFDPYDYNGKTEYVVRDGSHKGKKMGDLLGEFFNTDEGKEYLLNLNNGGGAPGGSRPTNAGTGIARKDLEAMSYEQRNAYMKGGGKVHE